MSARMEDTTVELILDDVLSTTNAKASAADSQGRRFFFALKKIREKKESEIIALLLELHFQIPYTNGVIPGIATCMLSESGTESQLSISGLRSSVELSAISYVIFLPV